jgi:hypothetical protein
MKMDCRVKPGNDKERVRTSGWYNVAAMMRD